jgi:hypothetical protein
MIKKRITITQIKRKAKGIELLIRRAHKMILEAKALQTNWDQQNHK